MDEPKEKTGPDLNRMGIFKEMSYHHEYIPVKISFNDASKKGKQMMTNCSKTKASTQDGFFDKSFQRVFKGEAYMDRIHLNRLYRNEKAKQTQGTCFKYSNPPRKPSGKGSNYGTFTDYEKKIEYFNSLARPHKKEEPQKRNFYTNPAQKGTGYGYSNLTIGKLPPYFLEGEYEELKDIQENLVPKKPQPRPFAPYRAGIFQQGYFDPNPYSTDKDKEPREGSDTSQEENKKAVEEKTIKPFLPTSPSKKDGGIKGGCLNSFPEYVSEPYPRIELVPRGVRQYVNKQNEMFRPVHGIRPYPVKSIINTNVKKQMNTSNFSSIKGVVYSKESRK